MNVSASPASSPIVTETIVEGGPRRRFFVALAELWRYRALVIAFAERDVRVKYKQAVLGGLWALVQPLVFMGIFTIAFGRFAGLTCGDVPYKACALASLVPWLYIQTAVSFGANALVADAALLRKVYFPRELPVVGAVIATGLDLMIGLALFAAIGPLLGAHFSVNWLLALPMIPALMLLALAAAVLLSGLNVYYRDFRYLLPVGLQIWLFGSPVAYPLSMVPADWRGLYVTLNPAAGLLDGFRRVLAAGTPPDWRLLLLSVSTSVLLFLLAYRVFRGLERNFADVV